MRNPTELAGTLHRPGPGLHRGALAGRRGVKVVLPSAVETSPYSIPLYPGFSASVRQEKSPEIWERSS